MTASLRYMSFHGCPPQPLGESGGTMPARAGGRAQMPVRKPGETLNGHKPWWHLRNWVTDLATLTRVRDGLRELPVEEAEEAWPEEAGPQVPPADLPAVDPAVTAIRETFAAVTDAGDPAVNYFYACLFAAHPGLRALFPASMEAQRDRLLRALSRIVESLGSTEELAAYLGQLGRDHLKYGVTPVMYEAVGDALQATLRRYAGERFTAAAREAWAQAYLAASAMMIRAAEEATGPAYWTAEVVGHWRCGDGIAALTVAPDGVLPYEAGQHVTIRHPKWHAWRPYSVACAPRDDGLLSFHVRAISGGWVSRALVHDTEPGDELTIGPALGGMTLAPAGGRDLLLVAGGTGLSAVKALTEQAVRDYGTSGIRRRICLFWGARSRAELYDLRSLWRLEDACPGLTVTPVTSDDPAFDGMQGNVGGVAARYMPHSGCEVYASGPEQMVRDTIRAVTRAGVPRERVHYDDALLTGRRRSGPGA